MIEYLDGQIEFLYLIVIVGTWQLLNHYLVKPLRFHYLQKIVRDSLPDFRPYDSLEDLRKLVPTKNLASVTGRFRLELASTLDSHLKLTYVFDDWLRDKHDFTLALDFHKNFKLPTGVDMISITVKSSSSSCHHRSHQNLQKQLKLKGDVNALIEVWPVREDVTNPSGLVLESFPVELTEKFNGNESLINSLEELYQGGDYKVLIWKNMCLLDRGRSLFPSKSWIINFVKNESTILNKIHNFLRSDAQFTQ
jgi:hypothetical protein